MRALVVDDDFPAHELEFSYNGVFDECLRLAARGVEIFVVSHNKVKEGRIGGIKAWGLDGGLSGIGGAKRAIRREWLLVLSALMKKQIINNHRESISVEDYRRTIERRGRENAVDLVHAQWAYPQGLSAALACEELRKPLVVTTRGFDINVEPSIGYGERLDPRKDRSVRKVFSYAEKILVESHFMERIVQEAGVDSSKIELVRGGVDLRDLSPDVNSSLVREAYSIGSRPVIFTMINDLSRTVKGVEYLLKTVPEVMEANQDVLFLIGGSHVTHKLLQLTRDLSIVDNVLFVGNIPRTQARFFFAAADVVAIPSIMEAAPRVALEAMASSRAIIATNVGGTPEVIKDGINGFLVPPRDYSAMAEKIVTLLRQPELKESFGQEGRRVTVARFDIEKRVNRIHSIYIDVLPSHTNLETTPPNDRPTPTVQI